MKTIIYSIIAIFIFGFIATGYNYRANTSNTILIQTTDKNVSSVLLSQSADIISKRLRDINSGKFTISLIPEKNQIKVVLTNTWDLKAAESLLIQKGSFAFYETFNHESLVELLKGDNRLFSMLNSSSTNHISGQAGCTAITEVEKVNNYVTKLGINLLCKFAWDPYQDDADVCLYALRLNAEKGALLSGSDIESVKCAQDKASVLSYIEIKFKESSFSIWSDATRRNINQVIAIVVDDVVVSAPLVREAIDGGSCQITGNFTQEQARYMAALLNNGELPVSFKIIK
jgi:preprotein translocase subunit SecD